MNTIPLDNFLIKFKKSDKKMSTTAKLFGEFLKEAQANHIPLDELRALYRFVVKSTFPSEELLRLLHTKMVLKDNSKAHSFEDYKKWWKDSIIKLATNEFDCWRNNLLKEMSSNVKV